MVLQCIRTEHPCHARIKSAAEECRDPSVLKTLPIRPLPAVFKMRRVFRLVICRIHIWHLRGQTRIHDMQILIRKRQIQHHVGRIGCDQRRQRCHVVRIDLSRCDLCLCPVLQFFFQGIALRLCPACDQDLLKYLAVLTTFMNGNACDSAATDDHRSAHIFSALPFLS